MCIKLILATGLVAATSLAGAPRPAATQAIQQCFRGYGDPLDACTTCSSSCYGAGYKCCIIVSGT